MEIAIPFLALGGMYLITKQEKEGYESKEQQRPKETFNNMGTTTNLQTTVPQTPLSNYLPNTEVPVQNYPITNTEELGDNCQRYSNPNVATDAYLNQNMYANREREGKAIDSSIQDIYSLQGDYLSSKEFVHNNMVPFTGSRVRGQIYNNKVAESVLDNYSGQGSQAVKKVEQAPLFKPQDNVQWTHGTPNMSDFYQSRVNPATRNNMVKPFESEHVGPGLDKGYTAAGSGGFNSGMDARERWMPKTVDELRVLTNPKEEYSLVDHQGPASSMIKERGIEGKVEKYKPDTFYANNPDRWFTTTGAEKGPRTVPEEIIKEQHRNNTTTYQQGSASSAIKTSSYVPNNYEPCKRIQLNALNVGASSATRTAPHHEDKDNRQKSYVNYSNNRSTVKNQEVFGSGFSNAVGAVIAPIMDIIKPSRREEYVCNARVYGNSNEQGSRGYVVSKGDVPKDTIKETTLYEPNMYVGNQMANAAYMVTEQQSISNQRDTTTECSYVNSAGGAGTRYGNRPYDAEYRRPTNSAKEATVAGRTNAGNGKLFNPNIHMTLKPDDDIVNNRVLAPSRATQSGPSLQTLGNVTQMPQYYEENDRINPEILDAIKSNPYAFPYDSVA
jgi:hypothetical protein